MNTNWFEAKVRYIKNTEDGRQIKTTESYIVDAMSYTEAEARILKEMETIMSTDYNLATLKKSNITEIIPSDSESDERWYKAKIVIVDVDEFSGKEKKANQYFLIAASNIRRALDNLEKSMQRYVIPYEIGSITDTSIMDVYPFVADEYPTESTYGEESASEGHE